MIPGELFPSEGEIEINAGRPTVVVQVANTGDRPIQVGSHYHFAETNAALRFDRAAARGMRLNIPAGTAQRFEPGQSRTVELVAYAGRRVVQGFNAQVSGPLDAQGAQPASAAAPANEPARSAKHAASRKAKATTGKTAAPATPRGTRR